MSDEIASLVTKLSSKPLTPEESEKMLTLSLSLVIDRGVKSLREEGLRSDLSGDDSHIFWSLLNLLFDNVKKHTSNMSSLLAIRAIEEIDGHLKVEVTRTQRAREALKMMTEGSMKLSGFLRDSTLENGEEVASTLETLSERYDKGTESEHLRKVVERRNRILDNLKGSKRALLEERGVVARKSAEDLLQEIDQKF